MADVGITLPLDEDYTLMLMIGDPDQIRFFRGDLAEDPADAIVNAANSDLCGVSGAIHHRGSPEIARECERIRKRDGPVPPGGAVATSAGQLRANYVIHAVGPVWQGGTHGEAKVMAQCYRESMRLADSLELHSIAFPAISTGIFRYPIEQAAWVAIPTVIDSLIIAKHVVMVSFVLFDRVALDAFASAVLALRQPGSDKPYEVAIAI